MLCSTGNTAYQRKHKAYYTRKQVCWSECLSYSLSYVDYGLQVCPLLSVCWNLAAVVIVLRKGPTESSMMPIFPASWKPGQEHQEFKASLEHTRSFLKPKEQGLPSMLEALGSITNKGWGGLSLQERTTTVRRLVLSLFLKDLWHSRTTTAAGCLVLAFSVSRAVSQKTSVHYKSICLWYGLKAVQSRLRQQGSLKSNMFLKNRQNFGGTNQDNPSKWDTSWHIHNGSPI